MRLVLALLALTACGPAPSADPAPVETVPAAEKAPVTPVPEGVGDGHVHGEGDEKDCPYEAKDKATLPPVDPAAPVPALAAGPVAKVVFLDQKDACPCTRRRIDAGWKALEIALGPSPAVPVERLFVDTDKARADTFIAMYPLTRLPGVFLLNADGKPVKVLSETVAPGEVKAAMGG